MKTEYDMSIASDVIIDNSLDMALQELDLMFNTERCEVLGDLTFGTTFERLLWTMRPDPDYIKIYIKQAMADAEYFNKFVSDINVTYTQGEIRPIYYVQIGLSYQGSKNKKYRQYEFK